MTLPLEMQGLISEWFPANGQLLTNPLHASCSLKTVTDTCISFCNYDVSRVFALLTENEAPFLKVISQANGGFKVVGVGVF